MFECLGFSGGDCQMSFFCGYSYLPLIGIFLLVPSVGLGLNILFKFGFVMEYLVFSIDGD